MNFRPGAAASLLAGAALIAVPASTSAAVRPAAIAAAPFARCYSAFASAGATIAVNLTGGTPGDAYQVTATYPGQGAGSAGSASSTTPFASDGTGSITLTGVFPRNTQVPSKGELVDLAVTDFNANGTTTTPLGSVRITNLALNISAKPTNPRKAREVVVSGSPFAGKPLYGFVTNKRATKVLRRFYLGRGNVCGYTARKAIVAPKTFAFGSYRIFINAGKKLDKPFAISEAFSLVRG